MCPSRAHIQLVRYNFGADVPGPTVLFYSFSIFFGYPKDIDFFVKAPFDFSPKLSKKTLVLGCFLFEK